MDLSKIISELKAERQRIGRAIAALEAANGTRRPGRPPKSESSAAPTRRRRNRLTPAGRKRLSEMMKKRWAERKKKAA